jgi:hypothetical protein
MAEIQRLPHVVENQDHSQEEKTYKYHKQLLITISENLRKHHAISRISVGTRNCGIVVAKRERTKRRIDRRLLSVTFALDIERVLSPRSPQKSPVRYFSGFSSVS